MDKMGTKAKAFYAAMMIICCGAFIILSLVARTVFQTTAEEDAIIFSLSAEGACPVKAQAPSFDDFRNAMEWVESKGDPNGWRKKSTEEYWQKVKARLEQ